MSFSIFETIEPAKESVVNDPYLKWQGNTGVGDVVYLEIIINESIFTARVDSDGNWEFELPTALAEGAYNLSARFYDAAGNAGAPIQTRLVVDLSPPEQPLIQLVMDNAGAVTGPVGDRGFTDDGNPTLSGYAEPGSIVRVYSNGMALGSVQAGKNGLWNFTPTLSDGEHRLTVTATDQFDRVSEPSLEYTLFINESRVPKPQLLEVYDNQGAEQGALKAGDSSDACNPRLSGSASADTEYVIIYANGVRMGTALVTNGKWQWEDPQTLLALGENSLTVRGVNGKGEISEPSDAFTFTVEAPSPPAVLGALNNNGGLHPIAKGEDTNDTTPRVHGRALPNTKIILVLALDSEGWLSGSNKTYELMSDKDGIWHFDIPDALADGRWHFRAKSVDAEGNESALGQQFHIEVDTQAPDAPIVAGAWNDNGGLHPILQGEDTNDTTPRVHGTAPPNTKVILVLALGSEGWLSGSNKSYELMSDKDGIWHFDIPDALADGQWHFRAKSVDAAGNESALGQQFHLNVNTHSFLTGDSALALMDQQPGSQAVDLTNGIKNTLDVDIATLLTRGEENLFIEDGKTQMRFNGDSEDTVRLETLLDGNATEGSWAQESGTTTVAGVVYNVYSHSGTDVEVLVQTGVKTEFM